MHPKFKFKSQFQINIWDISRTTKNSELAIKNIIVFLSYLWTTAIFSWSVWRSNMLAIIIFFVFFFLVFTWIMIKLWTAEKSEFAVKNIIILLSYLWTTASFSWSVWRSNISKSKASLVGPKMPPGILRKNFFRTEAMVLTEKLWMFTKRPKIQKNK